MNAANVRRQQAIEARADRRIHVAEAMLARLRGSAPRGSAWVVYDGCTLGELRALVKMAAGSSDWPQLTADVYKARLLDFYRQRDPAHARLTRLVPLRDFRPAKLLRPSEFPLLELVAEGAEIRVGFMRDHAEEIQLLTFARRYNLSDVAFTNDDVQLFNQTAELGADAAVFAQSALFFSVLLSNGGAGPVMADGDPFFHANHGNLETGSSVNATNLGAAMARMRKQTTPGEGAQPFNLAPRFVLVGPDNEVAALQAVASITPASASAPLLDVVVDARLAGEWFVFADPAQRPAFVRGYLERMGGPEPTVDTLRDWGVDGLAWRTVMRTAFGPYDFRAAVRNPGA